MMIKEPIVNFLPHPPCNPGQGQRIAKVSVWSLSDAQGCRVHQNSQFTPDFSPFARKQQISRGFSSARHPPPVSTCTTLLPAATVALRHSLRLVGTSLSSWASLRSISAGNTSLWSCFSTTPRRTVFNKKASPQSKSAHTGANTGVGRGTRQGVCTCAGVPHKTTTKH